MTSIKKTARFAGFLYFLQIPLGVFGFVYVPTVLIIPGNMTASITNILDHEFLFRLGMVSTILCALVTVATAYFIFKVLEPVNKNSAKWIAVFALIAAPITMLNELNNVAVLVLLKGNDYSSALNSAQMNTLISLFFDLHKYGLQLSGIFFGLWLLPMGYLVFKSNYIPKVIGVFLIITCLGYLIDFLLFFLAPNFGVTVSDFTWLGEVMMVLWLLIKGVNEEKYEKWNSKITLS